MGRGRWGLVVLVSLLVGCTLPQESLQDQVVLGRTVTWDEFDALQAKVTQLQAALEDAEAMLQGLAPLTPRVTRLETLVLPPAAKGKGKGVKAVAGPPTTAQLIRMANQEATVQPEAQGYFGKSAEYRYSWQPGRIYLIMLNWNYSTPISFPPGERLIVGLDLVGGKDAWDIKNERAGLDLLAYDVITIRPLTEKADVQGVVVSEGGRTYLLHFIASKDPGMRAVKFETPGTYQQTTTPEAIRHRDRGLVP